METMTTRAYSPTDDPWLLLLAAIMRQARRDARDCAETLAWVRRVEYSLRSEGLHPRPGRMNLFVQ